MKTKPTNNKRKSSKIPPQKQFQELEITVIDEHAFADYQPEMELDEWVVIGESKDFLGRRVLRVRAPMAVSERRVASGRPVPQTNDAEFYFIMEWDLAIIAQNRSKPPTHLLTLKQETPALKLIQDKLRRSLCAIISRGTDAEGRPWVRLYVPGNLYDPEGIIAEGAKNGLWDVEKLP